jgi:hypothetical protein
MSDRWVGYAVAGLAGYWIAREISRYRVPQKASDPIRDQIVDAYLRQVEPPDGEARENPVLYDPRLTVTDERDPFDTLYPERPQSDPWYLEPNSEHGPNDILEPELEGDGGDMVRIDGKLVSLEEAFGEYP